jgi:hypothetical protein
VIIGFARRVCSRYCKSRDCVSYAKSEGNDGVR